MFPSMHCRTNVVVTCGNSSLLPASSQCQPVTAPFGAGRAGQGVTLRGRHGTSHGRGERHDMETTQQAERQRTAAEQRRRELLEAADRVVLRDGPKASMNAIAAEAGHHQAHPLPALRRQGRPLPGARQAPHRRPAGRAAGRARRPRRAPPAGRGDARHLSRRDRGPPAGLPLPDAPVRGRASPPRAGLRRRPALGAAAAPARRGAGPGDRRAGGPRARTASSSPGSGATASSA